ncbi:MAG: thiamine-phosphate kinase [Desulfobacterales bacterium]|nr:thiamine-phosphate kinase [Desulfobacterales bacterium]MBF0396474.1 thiamine-phosphate kinase [Desulfobacterales bacterium]
MIELKEIGEFGFINKISKDSLIRPQNVLKAIGDDAAVFRLEKDEVILITTDMLVERIHFLRDKISGYCLGYKSLSVNLSDIAAMGGIAKEAFISIAIPPSYNFDYIEDIYRGIKGLAKEFFVNILGGDTTSSKSDLIINITVIGAAKPNNILYRSNAKVGDIICSTGFLGDSRAGLYILLNNINDISEEIKGLVNAHLIPKPYLKEGYFLANQVGVNAAIDVSDGLSSDLHHIIDESSVGATLFYESIPISENMKWFCNTFGFDPIEYAISGGEDYTLLCTLSPQYSDKIIYEYNKTFSQKLYPIGKINDSNIIEISYPDGRVKEVLKSGWDHFR